MKSPHRQARLARMTGLRALLIALPLALAALMALPVALYHVEPTGHARHELLPILRVVWPGGTRYQAGAFPEWEVQLPNGKRTRLRPASYRRPEAPDAVCVALRQGRWTGAIHVEQVPAAFCA